jgi:hypothetical protein
MAEEDMNCILKWAMKRYRRLASRCLSKVSLATLQAPLVSLL